MSKHVPPPTGEPPEGFNGLAAAVSPAWHQAIIRLANVSEKVASKLGWVLEHDQDNDPASVYVKNCRELVELMVEFLDGIEEDPDLEPTLGFMNGPAEMDECETPEDGEPSLASLDRMIDQTKWAAGSVSDAELDESDDEPSLGSGATFSSNSQAHWAQGVSDEREDDAGDDPEEENEHCDGRAEHEPSLGWPEGMAQGQGRWGDADDRELSAEPSAASGETARKRHNHSSICNVVPVNGEWWKIYPVK